MIITCHSAKCQNDTSSPLFSSEIISPGQTLTKAFTLKNDRQRACYPSFDVSSSSDQLVFKSDIGGEISGYSQKDFSFSVSLPSTTTNSFQGKTFSFDLNLNFRCEDEPISATTISPAGVLGTQTSQLPSSACHSILFLLFALIALLAGIFSKKLIVVIFAPIIMALLDFLLLPSGCRFYWWVYLISFLLSLAYFTKTKK